jgi:hypothetical protein
MEIRWDALGGVFNSAPAAVAWAPNRLDIFGLDTNNSMFHKAWNGSVWQPSPTAWDPLGGVFNVPPETRTFHQDVVTPGGTTLGGSVDLTFKSDGTYRFHIHAHNSSILTSYDFQFRAVFVLADGKTLVTERGGHLSGVDDNDFQTPNPADPNEAVNPTVANLIRDQWDDVKNGRLVVTRDYNLTDFAGFLDDVVKGIVDVTAATAGFAAGVVITVGYEIGRAVGGLDLGQTFGIIGGVVVFASGGGLLLAVAAGVAAGAVTNSAIKQRPMSTDEINFARKVFGDTISWGKIELTNLTGIGGNCFTTPFIGGKIYVNLGPYYNDPIHSTKNNYPAKGELFIHELTHAWQIEHASLLPTFMCTAVVTQTEHQIGEHVYDYGPPGPVWSSFGVEQQASIVDQWFGGVPNASAPSRTASTAMNEHDPYFTYIRDNIRRGHN